jgi:hypothetical protein
VARKAASQALEAEIARLPDLGLAELRARWMALYGRPAPKFFRRKLLVRAVAYQRRIDLLVVIPSVERPTSCVHENSSRKLMNCMIRLVSRRQSGTGGNRI